MTFEDFRKETIVKNKRHHKIKGSFGVKDSLLWCNKNEHLDIGKRVEDKEFYRIIRTVNNVIAEELVKGNDIRLPQRMGQLEVRKYENYVKLIDGKLHSNRFVDWNKTLRLWHEDEEAKENKLLVKFENKETFKLFYCKLFANYNNCTLYKFKPNRELAIKINKAGQAGLIDAYKIGK